MFLGPKRELVDPTIGECGDASGSSQRTEAMIVEQTALTKPQRGTRRRQLKKRVDHQEKSSEPATKEKEIESKRFRAEI